MQLKERLKLLKRARDLKNLHNQMIEEQLNNTVGILPHPSPCGTKHDVGKTQWALLPWRELQDVAQVMTLGVRKYSRDNWMHVPSGERRYFEAAIRHITARQLGEINDPETKLPHLAHAVCCLLFWMWFDTKKRRGHK